MLSVKDMDESILEATINISEQIRTTRAQKTGSGDRFGRRLRTCFRPGARKRSVSYCHQTDGKEEKNIRVTTYVGFNAALAT